MAGSQLQNVQRGIIFMQGSVLCLIGVLLTIKLIKKRIDLRKREERQEVEMESAAQKYRDNQVTAQKFQQAVVKDTVLTDDDTCTERFMKKMSELNTNFNPLMMGIVLSVVVGRSFAYEFSIYLIGLVCCMCFNVFKVHRACIDFILNRWAIEFLFPLSCLLLLIGLIVTENTTMLYTITQA